MSTLIFVRNVLLFGAPVGAYLIMQSVVRGDSDMASGGLILLAIGAVASIVPVRMRWGKLATWWFIIAYPDKHMPMFVFYRACATAFVCTAFFGYAHISHILIPGYEYLYPMYFWMCMMFGLSTVALLIANAKAYPHWMDVLDYLRGR